MADLRQISELPPSFIQSCCGGRLLPDKNSAQPRPPPRCADFEAGVSRRAQPDCIAGTAPRSCRRSRHDDRVTLDVEVGVQACRRLHFDESRRAEGAQPSHIEPQPFPDLEQILRRVP